MASVLFVCTANICRSPLAMVLWKHRLGAQAATWRIESAGTWTLDGEPAAARAQQALQEIGISLAGHRSRQVTWDLLREFNLVLVMEHGHKEAMQIEFPDRANRIYLLSEMVGMKFDIPDPIGGPLADFRMTVKELDDLLEKGFARICELAEREA